MNKFRIYIALFACLASLPALAQPDSKTAAMQALQQAAQHYRQAAFLSFDISYRYYDQQFPQRCIDSVKGLFRLSGNNFWYSVDGVETICNEKNVVVLYRNDQLMYLHAAEGAARPANPVLLLDSLLNSDSTIIVKMEERKGKEYITWDLPSNPSCKKVEYIINKKTGFIESMKQHVLSAPYVSPEEARSHPDGVAIIETRFSNYNTNEFNTGIFLSDRYFVRKGKEYVPVDPYRSYKVFVGSPSL